MCCLVLLATGLGPRIALLAWWIFGDKVDVAFDTWIWPFLGLLVLPWTTLFYVIAWSAIGASAERSGSSWRSGSCSTSLRTAPDRRSRAMAVHDLAAPNA